LSKNVDQLNNSMRNASLNASMTNGELVTPSIQAYKSDNAKLIKENNELHLELIKIRDNFDLEVKDLKSKLSKVEHENSDLRFLNTQYLHKLRAIEKESKEKTIKILELQEKNSQAVIQISKSVKNQQFSFRHQRLDIDCMLPPTSSGSSSSSSASSSSSSGCSCTTNSNFISSANDPYIIDMIKVADDRITHLQNELENFKQTNEILETKVSNYKNQVRILFF
jgi:centrosomal protein CEP135